MKKTEVIKHSAAIQISNRINLLQRRAWNVLLAQAFDDLPGKDEYQVSVKDLLDALNITTRNDKHLKTLLIDLTSTSIQWNMLAKDGKAEWGTSALLADAIIKDGVITYSYGAVLRKRLYSPAMYARISLSMQNKFDSKHALAIYELCVDYFDIQRHSGETPWINLDRYRLLMGLEDNEYPEFKFLNKWVIKDPVQEINDKSDLWVEVAYQRENRKVVAIKFFIKPNPNKDNALKQIEAKHPELPAPPDVEHPELYKRLVGYFCFSEQDARDALKEYSPEYITGNLNEIEQRMRRGVKIDNIRAYTVKALKHDYRTQKSLFDVEEEQRKAKKAAEQQAQERKEREKTAAEEAAAEEQARYFEELYASLSPQEKERVDQDAVDNLSDFFLQQYRTMKQKKEKLEDRPLLASALRESRNQVLVRLQKGKTNI